LGVRFNDIILEDQDCFAALDGWKELLHLIPDDGVAKRMDEKWSEEVRSSREKWDDIIVEYKKMSKGTQKVCFSPI
jgi:hypothetical protein